VVFGVKKGFLGQFEGDTGRLDDDGTTEKGDGSRLNDDQRTTEDAKG
jgi:hypothetical protein